jgi:glycosyltransferase involved in cell wall biosynthesis
MRIAYVLPDVAISGGAAVVFQHANRLRRRGHDVIVACTGSVSKPDWFPGQSAPVIRAADLPSDLDLLVATSWPTAFEILRHKARRACYFVQSDETRFYDEGSDLCRAARLSYELDLHYLTEARWIQRWLAETFGKTATVVRNGVDQAIFYPDAPLVPRTGKLRVLLEGAIALPFKGMKETFAALQGLDVETWCVSAYGKPKAGWRCDKFFEKVPMEKMRRIYSSCDILLKLSRVEGFFGPPLEMMACGGVCVVAKVSGYDEYIKDDENALVVEPGDVEGARRAVQKIVTSTSLRETLRRNGRKTADAFGWEPSIDALEAYFLKLGEDAEPGAAENNSNERLLLAYDKILSGSSSGGKGFQTVAHRIRKRIGNQLLLKAGEKIYLHVLDHKEFYRKVFRIKV